MPGYGCSVAEKRRNVCDFKIKLPGYVQDINGHYQFLNCQSLKN